MQMATVAADCQDSTLLAVVCAIALLYLRVTGPYWNLLESNTQHGDFHKYVQKMEASFDRWRGNAGELLDVNFAGVFDGESEATTVMKTAVYSFAAEHTLCPSAVDPGSHQERAADRYQKPTSGFPPRRKI